MTILHDKKNEVVSTAKEAAKLLQGWLTALDEIERDKEYFFVIHLDSRCQVRAIEVVTIGTVDCTLIHPREIFRRAIALGTSSIIAAHNHPSGVCEPSAEDYKQTKRLCQAGRLLGIEVLDHIIFSATDFYSIRRILKK